MKIAVDARPLSAPLTGIGRYTHSLLKRMLESDHQWYLYSDRPIQTDLPRSARLQVRTGDAVGGSPASLRWTQWNYVQWAKQDGIQVFWSPRHHLPLMLSQTIRQVVTIHDLVWKRFPETMLGRNRWLERALAGPSLRRADRVICVSGFTAAEIAHFYPREAGKCRVVHAAAEPGPENPPLPAGVTAPYLLFVGTMEPRKNLGRALDGYGMALRDGSVPPLVIVGGAGWGGIDVQEAIRAQGLAGRVEVLGFVEESQLQGLFRHAQGLLMPSLYEGFGLPVVESFQEGVPAIVSAGGALEEIGGDAVLTVDPMSAPDIRDAIIKLSMDASLRQRLSQRALARSTEFSWDRAASETLDLLVG